MDVERRIDALEWRALADECGGLADRVRATPEPFPAEEAQKVLGALRRKRRFVELERLAEAFEEGGQSSAKVLRLHAQALIDQGKLTVAQALLRDLERDPQTPAGERLEAIGLLGRVNKQRFVDACRGRVQDPPDERARRALIESAQQYRTAWESAPDGTTWHGINLVAVLARARRDGVELGEAGVLDEKAIAEDVLWRVATEGGPWRAATQLEANLALGRFEEMFAAARTYLADGEADAFEYASTLRQLVEVWGLAPDREPGNLLIPALTAAMARRGGGEVSLTGQDVLQSLASLQTADRDFRFERNFGGEAAHGIAWLKEGLQRCRAVARVETAAGKGIGTGFLVDPRDFFPPGRAPAAPVLLTNSHVISRDGRYPDALPPRYVRARFQADNVHVQVRDVIWESEALDASFVTLDPLQPAVAACPLHPPPAAKWAEGKRLYVIGHPAGRELAISLHDSKWLGANGNVLHYRTPTEHGSSGSPVFEDRNWFVVALHHGGYDRVPRVDGQPGTYEANEGIAIEALRSAVRETPTA